MTRMIQRVIGLAVIGIALYALGTPREMSASETRNVVGGKFICCVGFTPNDKCPSTGGCNGQAKEHCVVGSLGESCTDTFLDNQCGSTACGGELDSGNYC